VNKLAYYTGYMEKESAKLPAAFTRVKFPRIEKLLGKLPTGHMSKGIWTKTPSQDLTSQASYLLANVHQANPHAKQLQNTRDRLAKAIKQLRTI